MTATNDDGSEMLQRLRRIETKVHRVAVHVGAEPDATTMTFRVEEFGIVAQMSGYDFTFAHLKHALEDAKLSYVDRTVFLTDKDDRLMGTLRLTGKA